MNLQNKRFIETSDKHSALMEAVECKILIEELKNQRLMTTYIRNEKHINKNNKLGLVSTNQNRRETTSAAGTAKLNAARNSSERPRSMQSCKRPRSSDADLRHRGSDRTRSLASEIDATLVNRLRKELEKLRAEHGSMVEFEEFLKKKQAGQPKTASGQM